MFQENDYRPEIDSAVLFLTVPIVEETNSILFPVAYLFHNNIMSLSYHHV